MMVGRAGVWILLGILIAGGVLIPQVSGGSASLNGMKGISFPEGVAAAPFVMADEVEAQFEVEKFPARFDPPWKIEDTIGDSADDDESPALALNPNGTFLAMWQIKNGSRYDIGYLVSMKGNAWGGGVIKNTTFDARNISIAAFDDGRFMAIAEDWSNRTRLVRFVTSDEGNSWSIFIMNMESGAGGYKYVKISNPSLCSATNTTPGDTLFGSFDVVTNASSVTTVGILYSPSGGKTGVSYSHFIPQSSPLQNPRSSVSKSRLTGFMRGYITAEFTNGTNTDAVLLHNNLPSQGMWTVKQYSPTTASWEADPNIPSDGSTVLWVMRSGAQANGNIIAMKSTDDGKTFSGVVNVVSTGTNEQFPSCAIKGNVAWVLYADGAPTGNWKAVNSTDGGTTWGTPVNVATTINTLVAYSGTGEVVFTGAIPGTLWTDSRQQATQKRNVYFTSAPDLYPPGVVWTDPANGSINVTTFIKPQILFSEAMNATATEGALSFNPTITYTVEWPSSGLMKVIPITPLKPNTKYTVTIGTGAKDYFGGNQISSPYTFEFTTGVGDNKPPEISFIRPKNNENVSGIVEINATASDNIALAKVAFYIDTTEIVNFTHPPFMIKWDSTKVPDGKHNLSGTAWDTSGNSNTTKIVIKVVNQDHTPPQVKILSPANGTAVSKDVTIEIHATDDMGIKYVSIQVDKTEIANLTSPPYRKIWNSANVSDGVHEITAIASDLMGNKASDTIKVTTANHDTTPPAVSFIHPGAGDKLSGTVQVEISATDNLGIAKVELRIDSSIVKTFTSQPYLYNWTTTSVLNGNHILNATAYDGAENKGYAEITVEVKNGNTPPTITHTGVQSASEGSDIAITATITDDVSVKMASINITLGAGDIASVAMKPTGNGSEYSGVIPGTMVKPPSIGYYIYAEDNEGRSSKTSTYWVTVKRSSGFLSMDMLLIILAVVIVVVVVVVVFLVIRSRKKKAQETPSSPFDTGAPAGPTIRGPIPDFGIGEGTPQEETPPPMQPSPPGFMPSPGYPPPSYPAGGTAPIPPVQPVMPPSPQGPPPIPQPMAREEEWGFPSTGQTPVGVPATIECPLCGGTNPAGSKWCTNCGGKLV